MIPGVATIGRVAVARGPAGPAVPRTSTLHLPASLRARRAAAFHARHGRRAEAADRKDGAEGEGDFHSFRLRGSFRYNSQAPGHRHSGHGFRLVLDESPLRNGSDRE